MAKTKIPISQKPFRGFAKYLLIGLSCEEILEYILRVVGATCSCVIVIVQARPVYTQVETIQPLVVTRTFRDSTLPLPGHSAGWPLVKSVYQDSGLEMSDIFIKTLISLTDTIAAEWLGATVAGLIQLDDSGCVLISYQSVKD